MNGSATGSDLNADPVFDRKGPAMAMLTDTFSSTTNLVIAVVEGRKGSGRELAWALDVRRQIGDRWLRLLKYGDD